jgi:hypothetical protein
VTREQEVELVKTVISHEAGYDLDLFGGMLCIRSTGGPINNEETIEVEWQSPHDTPLQVKSFPKAELDSAARFFVEKRHDLGIGLDYEPV